MRALAVTEHLLSIIPVSPRHIAVERVRGIDAPDTVEVRLQFDTEGHVREFAAAVGATVTTSEHTQDLDSGSYQYLLVDARGTADGVPYCGWIHVYPDVPDTGAENVEPAERIVTRYRVGDGQEFTATGDVTDDGEPLYAEAGIQLAVRFQATAAQLRSRFGPLTVVSTGPAVTA